MPEVALIHVFRIWFPASLLMKKGEVGQPIADRHWKRGEGVQTTPNLDDIIWEQSLLTNAFFVVLNVYVQRIFFMKKNYWLWLWFLIHRGFTRDRDQDQTPEHILILRALLVIEIAPVHGQGKIAWEGDKQTNRHTDTHTDTHRDY